MSGITRSLPSDKYRLRIGYGKSLLLTHQMEGAFITIPLILISLLIGFLQLWEHDKDMERDASKIITEMKNFKISYSPFYILLRYFLFIFL